MLHVGLVKRCEEPIITSASEGGVLHVGVDISVLSVFPEIYALGISICLVCLSSL